MNRGSWGYLDELSIRLERALGDSLRAVYLTGSAAVGALREGSDLDVLVAVEGASRAQLDAVVSSCRHSALPCPAEKLELVVYEIADLASPGAVPRWSLNLNTGAHTHLVGHYPETEPAHWFVIDLAFAARHARALLGPPANELITEPTEAAIEAALAEMVEWYEQHEPDQAATARKRADHWRKTGDFIPKPGLPST